VLFKQLQQPTDKETKLYILQSQKVLYPTVI